MWGRGPLELWAERLSDWTWCHPCRQQRKLRVQKANPDTKSTRLVSQHWCSLIFVTYLVQRFLFPCLQVEGGELQPVLRHDSGRGHPLPSGHPEALQDYHEHEWDPGNTASFCSPALVLKWWQKFHTALRKPINPWELLTFDHWLRKWNWLTGPVGYPVTWVSWVWLFNSSFPQLPQPF